MGANVILVVDDAPANLDVVVNTLEAYAFEVLTARDGESGILRAQRVKPDVILLDVEMPGLDGYEVCRRLKAHPDLLHIPIIFLTVRAGRRDKEEAFLAGAADFVTKPIEPRELLARVRVHCRLHTALRALQQANARLETALAERADEVRQQLALSTAAAGDRSSFNAERQRLLAIIGEQSAQIRALTESWVAEQRRMDRGAYGTLKERVLKRLELVATLHSEARRVVLAHAVEQPELSVASEHLERAGHLLAGVVRPDAKTTSAHDDAADSNPLRVLSDREAAVLRLMLDGRSAKEISASLGVARTTVNTYRHRMMEKLQVETQAALFKLAVRYLS